MAALNLPELTVLPVSGNANQPELPALPIGAGKNGKTGTGKSVPRWRPLARRWPGPPLGGGW